MIRLFLIVLQITGVMVVNLLFTGDISVTMDVPQQIDAGKETKVQITLNKGSLAGFSRFQMDLPAGVTATNIYSANADFSFKDQKVRLIWLRLPDDETLTISFTILCNEHLKGSFDLAGKFSYIENNERKEVDLQPKQLAIIPSPNIDPNLLVDIKDYGRSAFPQMGTSPGELACVRQKPGWSENNNQYLVTLLVNKESLKKFAKIEEQVSAGFTALAVDTKDGVFTFKDNKAKFLWMSLPADPYFTVSYKLIPMKNTAPQQPIINGVFSYIVEDKTQSLNIIEKDVNLANLTPELVKNILQQPTQGNQMIAQNVVDTKNEGKNQGTEKVVTPPVTTLPVLPKDEGKSSVKPDLTKSVAEAPVVADTKTKTNTVRPPVLQSEVADLLEPQTGLYFRVQIAAGHRPVDTKRYFKKYQLDTIVMKENHEGWIKYSVGSFTVYKVARDYRVHLWNTTSISDAFVAAYNDGKRITVQEALMIGNQKWYQ